MHTSCDNCGKSVKKVGMVSRGGVVGSIMGQYYCKYCKKEFKIRRLLGK